MQNAPDRYDGAWQAALDEYLPECLSLLFPAVHNGIDWRRPYTLLDTELQQVVRDAEIGARRADRLVQVWLPDGRDTWLLIHLEVQSQHERDFAKRMFRYFYRIGDRYDHEVVSLAVLADDRINWRPDRYEQERWGCGVQFWYPVVKLAAWRTQRQDLEASDNPFAMVVLAHLAAQDTRGDAAGREAAKLGLIRRLYARGWDRERVLSLLRFVDWLLALPAAAELRIWETVAMIEKERHVPYVMSFERLALARGREQGLEQGIERGRLEAKREDILRIVEARFGAAPGTLAERLAVTDEAGLDALLLKAVTVASLTDL